MLEVDLDEISDAAHRNPGHGSHTIREATADDPDATQVGVPMEATAELDTPQQVQ